MRSDRAAGPGCGSSIHDRDDQGRPFHVDTIANGNRDPKGSAETYGLPDGPFVPATVSRRYYI